MIVADNGARSFTTGEPNPRWHNQILDQLKTLSGQSFEVVYTGEIVTKWTRSIAHFVEQPTPPSAMVPVQSRDLGTRPPDLKHLKHKRSLIATRHGTALAYERARAQRIENRMEPTPILDHPRAQRSAARPETGTPTSRPTVPNA